MAKRNILLWTLQSLILGAVLFFAVYGVRHYFGLNYPIATKTLPPGLTWLYPATALVGLMGALAAWKKWVKAIQEETPKSSQA